MNLNTAHAHFKLQIAFGEGQIFDGQAVIPAFFPSIR